MIVLGKNWDGFQSAVVDALPIGVGLLRARSNPYFYLTVSGCVGLCRAQCPQPTQIFSINFNEIPPCVSGVSLLARTLTCARACAHASGLITYIHLPLIYIFIYTHRHIGDKGTKNKEKFCVGLPDTRRHTRHSRPFAHHFKHSVPFLERPTGSGRPSLHFRRDFIAQAISQRLSSPLAALWRLNTALSRPARTLSGARGGDGVIFPHETSNIAR